MAWRGLTQQQGNAIRVHLPPPTASTRGGRPRVDDRRCLEGILWLLWAGAQWSELPRRYGRASTCWRRLKAWEETGVLLQRWRAFLAQLNDRQQLRWDECFADGSFVPAKQGEPRSARPSGARGRSGWCWSMARGPPLGAVPGRGLPGGGHAPRKGPRHHCRWATRQTRAAAQAPAAAACRPRLRQHPLAGPLGASGHRADQPSPCQPHARDPSRRTDAAALPAAADCGAYLRLARAFSTPGRAL
jgi:transposase